MGINVKESLAAQGLDESDLEANRSGRVSEKQIARQVAVRSWGKGGVWTTAICFVVGSVGFGTWRWLQYGDAGVAIFMSILGLVMAALPLGIYYAFRFADPKKIGACKVTLLENAEVGVFLPAPLRGVYAISLNRKRYSGFANLLSRAHFGARVNAYVVPEHQIVVALEPLD